MQHLGLAFIFAPQDIFLILAVGLVIFGPKRLPELGEGLGKGIRGFKDAVTGLDLNTIAEPRPTQTALDEPTHT